MKVHTVKQQSIVSISLATNPDLIIDLHVSTDVMTAIMYTFIYYQLEWTTQNEYMLYQGFLSCMCVTTSSLV